MKLPTVMVACAVALVIFAGVMLALGGCSALWDQRPVCPRSHPQCTNDDLFGPIPSQTMGATHDAGGDAR